MNRRNRAFMPVLLPSVPPSSMTSQLPCCVVLSHLMIPSSCDPTIYVQSVIAPSNLSINTSMTSLTAKGLLEEFLHYATFPLPSVQQTG
ncbi:hypothetical protein RCO48_25335 [Peribacillus frigoritolerans]|nr:hypothetical protein [Peribacillus frigoritolerans]